AKRGAEARERLAEAEARATEVVSQAIAKGDSRAINYFVAQKYIDALGQLAASNNNKVMMIPLEAASVIGSIAGISEIAKEVVKDKTS
ncbi:MAG: regulator of protease activity HflC (stomatin/prohibitin superfamily), partial [Candidatus Azotimanducaceae bacterium]